MGKINLDDIKPGMILASAVTERGGRILLSAGTEITERHLNIFRTWGIAEADVEGVTKEEILAQATARLDPTQLKEAEAEVNELFRHAGQRHPAMTELSRLCILRRVGRNRGGIQK
jgi:hypothetical protein